MSIESRRLVIVDDSPVMIGLLKKVVKDIDAEIFLTGDFEEAVEYCVSHEVDALITDLNLDDKSGFALIEAARGNADNSDISSFIMSAESPKDYRAKMKELNVRAWIMKPINPAAFKAMLNKLFSH